MSTVADTPTTDDAPLTNFTQCHAGIVRRLRALDELPGLLAPAARARSIAEQSLAFFREAIFEHHLDEERELFPAVLASAQPGEERAQVQAMVERLTSQHRTLEALWRSLEKDLRRVAKGQDSDLEIADLHRLVSEYQAHAGFEESSFLPLAETILGRNGNHMAALGLSLHMRHAPQPVPYI
ncbi:MAG: hemerythrin domain-containing protein [Hydrogenophaga sp.]|uniref:hemerythrin domain-containing protein n=1 Tax=Hydrogenophaga sp. TaxID=1904254 RepID=UPI001D65B9FB|nr:hemerythrin domain-containing protein [Hydrogenophaga sp.]MBX3611436.1 hemerythrin domain-containing protein [Hydrogenophaga sp.]